MPIVAASMAGRSRKAGAAIGRVKLNPELTQHSRRHTWASWHYALHKDLLLLKQAGGWSSVALVERYAHLLPAGQESAIKDFLHLCDRGVIEASVIPRSA